MDYEVKTISCEEEIENCSHFKIDHHLWKKGFIRPAYGRLGFIEDQGLFLTMTCEERNPLRTFHEANTPVYLDSAMEAFFCFDQASGIYLNFEMNANGALLAMYGSGRSRRKPLPPKLHASCQCKAVVNETSWSLSLHIPLSVLDYVYGSIDLKKGSCFTCNFYKISETPAIEHYASFSPVLTQAPDFHRPEYFSDAVLV